MNTLNIKELRKKLKMTQTEFGKVIGVTKRTVVNYEKGVVTISPARLLILNNLAAQNHFVFSKNLKKTPIIKNLSISELYIKNEDLEKLLEEKDKLLEEKDKLLAAQQEIIALLKNNK